MKRLKNIPDNSNGLVLKPWELVVTAAAVLVLTLAILPYFWRAFGRVELPPDFRLAEELRDDYYGYRMVARAVCAKYPAVFLGDSVVWGMYVGNAETLPELVNAKLGRDEIGNLAVDGLHPVAMEKLVEEFGGAIRGKRVYLYWNPLWMNKPDNDLSGTEEVSINHPRLLPQFDPSLKNYRAKFSERRSAQLDQSIAFCAWLRHIRAACCDNEAIKNALASGTLHRESSPAERKKQTDGGGDWKKRHIPKQNWPWVAVKNSRQYAAFRRTIDSLEKRGNKVTVVLGTINPHMQTEASLARYRKLRAEVKADLERSGVVFIDLPELKSGEYADASHPLAAGYEKLAEYMIYRLNPKEK